MAVSPKSSTEADLSLGKPIQVSPGSHLHRMPIHSARGPSGSESEEQSDGDDSHDDATSITEAVATLSVDDLDSDEDSAQGMELNQAAGPNKGRGNTKGQSAALGAQASPSRADKRAAGGPGKKPGESKDNKGGGDGNGGGDKKRLKLDTDGHEEVVGSGYVACPFRKRNPGRFNYREHKTCTRGFRDISDVKDHVNKTHLRPPNASADDPENGIDNGTTERLRSRSRGRVNTWTAVWNTLFPNDNNRAIPSQDHEPPLLAETFEIETQILDKVFPSDQLEKTQLRHEILSAMRINPQSREAEMYSRYSDQLGAKARQQCNMLRNEIVRVLPHPTPAPSTQHRSTGQSTTPPQAVAAQPQTALQGTTQPRDFRILLPATTRAQFVPAQVPSTGFDIPLPPVTAAAAPNFDMQHINPQTIGDYHYQHQQPPTYTDDGQGMSSEQAYPEGPVIPNDQGDFWAGMERDGSTGFPPNPNANQP